MNELLHHFISNSARRTPDAPALRFKGTGLSYRELDAQITLIAAGLLENNLLRSERIAVYLPKRFETVIAFFATSLAGGVFVPVNPILKAEQVCHILKDCNARFIITSRDRLRTLENELTSCHDLHTVILVDDDIDDIQLETLNILSWQNLMSHDTLPESATVIDTDMLAILYTSGSTGRPKGVVLSQRNMVTGAKSVAQYLNNKQSDIILAVLPFSFDYGFSQLSTAFYVGASVVLMDYLLPRDVIRTVAKEKITGLAAVPPLWIQLSQLDWPPEAVESLRYVTNSGGAMPVSCIDKFKSVLPTTQIYLMYGLTEAFRSTYLPPEEIHRRPESMGKAIPNAEILVVREDGSPCAPGETGELIHRGSLVAMGYWNDHDKTAERFRPLPNQNSALPLTEIAVWSGDNVKMDEDGFLYFISRKDEMIKTSGYRVSPTEVEEVIYKTGLVNEAVAIGIPHFELGQAIVLIVTPRGDAVLDLESIKLACKQHLPNFMVPTQLIELPHLPRNPNGKIDRKNLALQFRDLFQEKPQ